MNDITDLHRKAMELADNADRSLRRGDDDRAAELLRNALELERRAAELVEMQSDNEPTRSVLLRSAASLALQCGEYREAERLIATALAGSPPPEICEELRDLLEQLYAGTGLRSAASV